VPYLLINQLQVVGSHAVIVIATHELHGQSKRSERIAQLVSQHRNELVLAMVRRQGRFGALEMRDILEDHDGAGNSTGGITNGIDVDVDWDT
jgi:hypothetical protein